MSSPSIAIVVLDTLRKDTFSRYFEWVPGVQFDNAYSTSHWTIPAHASLLAGQYASELGVHSKSRSFDYPGDTIVEVLQNSGYFTRMWTANMQIHTWEGWERGFDEVVGSQNLHPKSERSVDWRSFSTESNSSLKYVNAVQYAVSSSESTVHSLVEGYRRFRSGPEQTSTRDIQERYRQTTFGDTEFLLLNLMDAHTPHYPEKPYRTFDRAVDFGLGCSFGEESDNPDRERRAYDDSAMYMSDMYKYLFKSLKDDFDIIITLSDHGELLGENGIWLHSYGIFPAVVQIPLYIWCDEGITAFETNTRSDTVSLIDLPQTIAGLAGVEFECRGRDLVEDTASRDRLVEYHGLLPWLQERVEQESGFNKHHNEPLNGVATARGEYFFESHEKDSDFGSSLSKSQRSRINNLVSDLDKRDVTTEGSETSESVKSRLEHLGYA